ncbi:PstS family phosphate ABC transporter substrate-binding protein [Sporosarcina koreensis]|uniref:PstS family phosphate ABC transporter substrate-binding protein n=1 Tax=Sporosarcina koreensis TaxID=334735 RepID=UPI00069404C0|nr:substrate-binding domain-containing protein [Sporosarcina koreensis]
MDGATAYYPMYAAFVQAVYSEGSYEHFTGDGTVLTEHPRYAYHRLMTGDRDIIFAPAPTAAQQKRAEEAGLELKLTPVAKEAFVFYVPRGNRVSGLTEQEIRGIYGGGLAEWSDVGGRKEPIITYQRKTGSRSQQEMERIMDGTPFAHPPTEPVSEFSSGGIVRELAEYRNSRGAIGYSYRNTAQPLAEKGNVKLLEVDGIPPGTKEIQSGAYPYIQTIYAVTAGSDNPNTGKLIEWILSDERQRLVAQSGFTPIRQTD